MFPLCSQPANLDYGEGWRLLLSIVAITKGVAWCFAALVAFPAGIVSVALLDWAIDGPARQVEVTLAGPEFSTQGARYVDFAGARVLLSQVCDGVCDQVSLTYPDHRRAPFHFWVRTAERACISCADQAFGERDKVHVGAAAQERAGRRAP